jgi:competence protein ComEC
LITESGAQSASGTVWVRMPAKVTHLNAGDRVRVTGRLDHISPPMNPGEPDRPLWAAQEGRIGMLGLTSPELVKKLLEPPGLVSELESSWLRTRAWLQDRAHSILLGDHDADSSGRAVLAALVLGEEGRSLREVRGTFNRMGLAHILSVSGFHFAVMVGVILVLLRLTGDLGRAEPLITAALVALYLSILPFNAPVWRSGLMVLGLLGADALGRRYDRLTLLGWIAFVLLIYRPMDAWSIGFQLSFGMVALLIWLGRSFHERLFGIKLRGTVEPDRGWLGWFVEQVKRLVSTGLLCGIAATPIVAYHTGMVSPVAVGTSIVLIPPITLLLIAGYVVLLLGVLVPPLGEIASACLGVLADWTVLIVRWFDSIPGTSTRIPPISLPLAIVATIAILYCFARGRVRDPIGWVLSIAVIGWTIAEFRTSTSLPPGTRVRIDTLAVGDGTCHLIRSGREAMLWDCGSLSPGIGEMVVPRAVRAVGGFRVRTALVTHPNLDHFNGLIDAAEPLGLKLLLVGNALMDRAQIKPHSPEAYLLEQLRKRGIDVQVISAGDQVELGEVTLEFISPPPNANFTADNDWSLVARIVPKGGATDRATLALMTGDVEAPAIDAFSEAHPHLKALVVEAPHHGSAKEAGIALVPRLAPEVVLQSTSLKRANDPRWKAVRDATMWYCTALDGAAWVEVRDDASVRSGTFRSGLVRVEPPPRSFEPRSR